MKKEIFAGALLSAMLAVALYNIHSINNLTGELMEYVDAAGKYAVEENWDKAVSYAEDALAKWKESYEYTHIVLKHDRIDLATEGIYHLLQTIYTKDSTAAKVTARELYELLDDIYESEQLRLGSIL